MMFCCCRSLVDGRKRLTYVGCAGPLLLNSQGNIDNTLEPDAFHPNVKGYDKLFTQCYDGAIKRVLADRPCKETGAGGTPCTTGDGAAGRCSGGACKVGS